MKIKATANGLTLDEPQVIAIINGGKPTTPKSYSDVVKRYGDFIDFDRLRTFGYQYVDLGSNSIVFKFVK